MSCNTCFPSNIGTCVPEISSGTIIIPTVRLFFVQPGTTTSSTSSCCLGFPSNIGPTPSCTTFPQVRVKMATWSSFYCGSPPGQVCMMVNTPSAVI